MNNTSTPHILDVAMMALKGGLDNRLGAENRLFHFILKHGDTFISNERSYMLTSDNDVAAMLAEVPLAFQSYGGEVLLSVAKSVKRSADQVHAEESAAASGWTVGAPMSAAAVAEFLEQLRDLAEYAAWDQAVQAWKQSRGIWSQRGLWAGLVVADLTPEVCLAKVESYLADSPAKEHTGLRAALTESRARLAAVMWASAIQWFIREGV